MLFAFHCCVKDLTSKDRASMETPRVACRRCAGDLRVLVSSPDGALGKLLKAGLRSPDLEVVACLPGPSFMAAARRERPDIAVIDRVDERPDAATMEVLVLKDLRSDVRIIAVSGSSSPRDARVVEHGVFYYLAAPPGAELIQVVEAAARTFCRSVREPTAGEYVPERPP
jgi:DNA-binding response OmpR family regulator